MGSASINCVLSRSRGLSIIYMLRNGLLDTEHGRLGGFTMRWVKMPKLKQNGSSRAGSPLAGGGSRATSPTSAGHAESPSMQSPGKPSNKRKAEDGTGAPSKPKKRKNSSSVWPRLSSSLRPGADADDGGGELRPAASRRLPHPHSPHQHDVFKFLFIILDKIDCR